MKITQDLRLALKAIVNAQKHRSDSERDAIADFFTRKPEVLKRFAVAQKKVQSLKSKIDALYKQLKEVTGPLEKETGLSWYSPESTMPRSIGDRTKFEAAGGTPVIHFGTYNGLIVRLAQASEEEGLRILKTMGIDWSEPKGAAPKQTKRAA